MAELTNLQQAVIDGDYKTAEALAQEALGKGVSALDICGQGVIPAMAVVGQKMKSGEYFIPEVLMSVKAMNAVSGLINPLLAQSDAGKPFGKVILGTIKGDLHDIGKNLVGIMLKGAGFEIVDLGNDVTAERFVDAAVDSGAKVIGISALLTTTMSSMKDVVDLVQERGLAGEIHTIVGGAPVSKEFADEIGADAYGYDAANAVEQVKALTGV